MADRRDWRQAATRAARLTTAGMTGRRQTGRRYRQDDAKLREAEEWVAGSFDSSHYTDLTLALFALHNTDPDKLAGSDLLAGCMRWRKSRPPP